MRRRAAAAVAAVAVAVAVGGGTVLRGGDAGAALPPARSGGHEVLVLVNAHPSPPARGRIESRLTQISTVAPAWLSLADADGRLRYQAGTTWAAGLAEHGARLAPVVRDPGHLAPGILRDERRRRQLAMRLAASLHGQDARGVVLDLGDLPPDVRAAYPAFVRALKNELGDDLFQIYVAVPPVTDAGDARRAAGYDVRDLARPAVLLLKAWDEHGESTEPGPVASLDFFKRAVRDLLARAPRAKVLIGVSTWGWQWEAGARGQRATQAALYPMATEPELLRPDGARVRLPAGEAWVESDRSVQLKLLVARNSKARGVALWVRGGESRRLWEEPLLRAEG